MQPACRLSTAKQLNIAIGAASNKLAIGTLLSEACSYLSYSYFVII